MVKSRVPCSIARSWVLTWHFCPSRCGIVSKGTHLYSNVFSSWESNHCSFFCADQRCSYHLWSGFSNTLCTRVPLSAMKFFYRFRFRWWRLLARRDVRRLTLSSGYLESGGTALRIENENRLEQNLYSNVSDHPVSGAVQAAGNTVEIVDKFTYLGCQIDGTDRKWDSVIYGTPRYPLYHENTPTTYIYFQFSCTV